MLGLAKSAGHAKKPSKQAVRNIEEIHQAEVESSKEGNKGSSLKKKNGEKRQGVVEPQTQFKLSLKETQLAQQSPTKAGSQTGSVIELVLSEQQVKDQIFKEGLNEIQFVSKDGANRGTFILVQEQLSKPVASRKRRQETTVLTESTPTA